MHLNFGAINKKLDGVVPIDKSRYAVLLAYAKCDPDYYQRESNYGTNIVNTSSTAVNSIEKYDDKFIKIDSVCDFDLKRKKSVVSGDNSLIKQVISEDHAEESEANNNEQQIAVQVCNANFFYRTFSMVQLKKLRVDVLTDCTINVPEGNIYALLGSSGCGKTTLLKCILGRLKLKSGSVRVFGCPPNSIESGVPGRNVGYMPQELALFGEITIESTLKYFGRIYDMTNNEITNRIDFILNLLHLPPKDRLISQLSGGQQRRVSLAVALLHTPPLLILDEPTVGVDPLLRQEIWHYLKLMCKEEKSTIIITTHYIEEARSAGTVGLMRGGRLLAEDNPEVLINKYVGCKNLEDVFLLLCQHSDKGVKQQIEVKPNNANAIEEAVITENGSDRSTDLIIAKNAYQRRSRVGDNNAKHQSNNTWAYYFSWIRMWALFSKNWMKIKGNRALFIMYFLPSIQLSLFCASVGKNPRNLHVAIYNPENPPQISQYYFDTFDKNMITQDTYNSLEDSTNAVIDGKAWAAVYVHKNFSKCLRNVIRYGPDVSAKSVNCSKVMIQTDVSNPVNGLYLFRALIESFEKTLKYYLNKEGYNEGVVSRPIELVEKVYGTDDPSVQDFMAPGVILALVFVAPFALTGFTMVQEHKQGLLERSIAAGVRPLEVILSHFILQMLVLVVEVVIMLFTTFYVWEIRNNGSLWELSAIVYLIGVSGISYGIIVSTIFPDEATALIVGMGLIFPTWFTCGLFWPIEAMLPAMKEVSYYLQLTLPTESMRMIMFRSWDLTYLPVVLGFLVSFVYIIVPLAMAVLVFQFFY